MFKPLIVFIPAEKREDLRNCDVLPPSLFHNVGGSDSDWHKNESCVRLWTKELVYDADAKGGIPPHPAKLLSLDTSESSLFANENLVAKFFGAWILHIVFLDPENSSQQTSSGRFVTVDKIIKTASWAKTFNESVKYWFSEEQSRDIKHAVLVIAKDGLVRLSQEQRAELLKEFSDNGTLNTCYFLDIRLEPELGNDSLASEYLWPILAGRLLLRLLIALAVYPYDDILLPGVHLWRSFEFLFDYPVKELSGMLTQALNEAYARLNEVNEASSTKKTSFGNKLDKASIFPLIPKSLTSFNKIEPIDQKEDDQRKNEDKDKDKNNENKREKIDWHSYNSSAIVDKLVNNDDKRWGESLNSARIDFNKREAKLLSEGNPASKTFSPYTVFSEIPENPKNVSIYRERLKDEKPDDSISKEKDIKTYNEILDEKPDDSISEKKVYNNWKKVIEKEEKRRKEQNRLRQAGVELSLAQAHYVTAPYAMAAVISVSLFCGLTLFLVLNSVGLSFLTSFIFSAISVAGAFSAWGIISHFHGRAGQKAVKEFQNIAKTVDSAMDARHEAAVDAVREAEFQHRKILCRYSWESLNRLLERVWRILSRELQSPTLSAFYRDETGQITLPAENSSNAEEASKQREDYLAKTRFVEPLKGNAQDKNHECSDEVINNKLGESGSETFNMFWKQTCETVDKWCHGNLPAEILIPKIREWLIGLCDALCAAQKADLLKARGGKILPDKFDVVRNDSNFVLASAHIDECHVENSAARLFVFKETKKLNIDVVSCANKELKGAKRKIPVTATDILNRVPQIAVYFQDIRIYGFDCEKDGRLKFLTKHEAETLKAALKGEKK